MFFFCAGGGSGEPEVSARRHHDGRGPLQGVSDRAAPGHVRGGVGAQGAGRGHGHRHRGQQGRRGLIAEHDGIMYLILLVYFSAARYKK